LRSALAGRRRGAASWFLRGGRLHRSRGRVRIGWRSRRGRRRRVVRRFDGIDLKLLFHGPQFGDILLVLIIVFMVIVATSKEYVVNTQLPDEAKGEQPHQNERTIVIQIIWSPRQPDPLLKINQESVAWDDLEPALARIFLSRAEKIAYVKGDDDLDFEYVAQVIADHSGRAT